MNVVKPNNNVHPEEADEKDSDKKNLFYLILNGASEKEIRRYLDAHPEAATGKNKCGQFPLHYASESISNTKVLMDILNAHPQAAGKKDNIGWFPLHHAVAHNKNLEVVKLIFDAHPEAAAKKTKYGHSPLHMAAYNENPEVVKLILDAHPEAAAKKDNYGCLPLHRAANNNNPEVVRMILDAHPEAVVKTDNFSWAPLDFANYSCKKDVIEFLESAFENYMDNAPKEFICPITQSIMKDPVVAEDGNTYERADIVQWFEVHDTSPLTNIVLESNNVVPNRALKSLIDSYMGK